MISYNILFLLLLPTVQCYNSLNISMGILNAETVIACGSSIDIYPSFDSAQILICPYVFIVKDKIQLIHMNISIENNNEIIIYSNPQIIPSPELFVKLSNNSFISTRNINMNDTYYFLFSSELTCKYSLLNNKTICFYYPASGDFIHLEYHYDEIIHGSLTLSNRARNHFYLIFFIIIILISCIACFSMYILCTSQFPLRHISQLDAVIDKYTAKQEAAKRPQDPLQDGAAGHPILPEHQPTHEIHVDG